MRLDKLLANSGIGTRSDVRRMIARGLVKVNGTVVVKADFAVSDSDAVECADQAVCSADKLYFLLDKPDEVLTAMEDPRLRNVGDFIPDRLKGRKLAPVGRLDYHTTGALIITNDGTLSHRLQSPKYKIPKVYLVTFIGSAWTAAEVNEVAEGTVLTDKDIPCKTAGAKVFVRDNIHATITLTEGKTHEVRRIFAHYNKEVTALRRISLGDIVIADDDTNTGDMRELTGDEVAKLLTSVGL
ncbi:MAG: rRNA pseudouridine synthase [Saccharofermentans sp.]|jgi:16S rRNA pseudouridine516 synthase|nr:rRNA pseudouridine synthase [Mageeibacillus sp.]MCI1264730.1 rRNA pseudouridine synthase [Saccharofermentans sp.]MCI1274589.1 rRNA pseudouridine synthase [Saccharofermentans sp.]MCI1770062.1 rRNA pseudouridine synthase [Mageeibacillus sp.]MCI2043875.1 rRNA pseudouridine synthase [Mageeibacillus sp.]